MSPEDVPEAIKETRRIVTVLLTTAVLALLTTDAVQNALVKRERAKHLAAWLLLRDTFAKEAHTLGEAPETGRIEGVTEQIPIQSGTEVDSFRPFVLHVPWPGETIRKISIERIAPESPAFRVHAPDGLLPFEDYALALVHEKTWVLPLRYTHSHSLREISNAILRDKLAAPWGWAATRVHLHSNGWSGQAPEDLQFNDSKVAEFIRDGLTASYSILGVPISPGYYAAAISVVLGFQAFLLLGPWLTLRDWETALPSTSWIMLSGAGGSGRRWLRVTQTVVSIIAILLPLLVLLTQLPLVPYMTIRECLVYAPTILGPLAAAALLAALAARFILRRSLASTSDYPSNAA
jgi:hypothetical protein